MRLKTMYLVASLALSSTLLLSGCKSSTPAPAPAPTQSASPDATPAAAPQFPKFSDDCCPACGIADDFGSRSARTACGSCGGSATSSTSSAAGKDYCSGRNCCYGDRNRTAECEP